MTIDNWTGTETAADMTFIISLCGAGVSPPSVATCNLSTSVCPRWPDLLHWPHSNSVHLCTSVSVSNISSIAPLRLLGKVGCHRETIRQHWCRVSGVLWVSLLSRRDPALTTTRTLLAVIKVLKQVAVPMSTVHRLTTGWLSSMGCKHIKPNPGWYQMAPSPVSCPPLRRFKF